MEKIIDYCILLSTVTDLENEVKAKITEGWQPFGTPFKTDMNDKPIAQVLVKYQPGGIGNLSPSTEHLI